MVMVDRLVGARGTLDSAWGLRHETPSMALLVYSSATVDTKLKFTEAAPMDRYAVEKVNRSGSLLAADAAACSCLASFFS